MNSIYNDLILTIENNVPRTISNKIYCCINYIYTYVYMYMYVYSEYIDKMKI